MSNAGNNSESPRQQQQPPPPAAVSQQQQQQQFNPAGVGHVNSGTIPSAVQQAAAAAAAMNNSSVTVPGLLSPSSALEHYRLSQLYQYAMAAERLRCPPGTFLPPIRPEFAPFLYGPYCRMDPRLALCRPPEEPKPQHSYIGLIAMAILSSPEKKLVLSDIYQYILDNYPYFRSRGPGWRNSIRHNLSLNDCFVKAGRSANGKGHYWAIHAANEDDFRKGDFRRRKAQRKVRRHMGLAVDDEDSPSPPSTSPPPGAWHSPLHHPAVAHLQPHHPAVAMAMSSPVVEIPGMIFGRPNNNHHHPSFVINNASNNNNRKRQFDVASLLAPEKDSDAAPSKNHHKSNKNDEDSPARKPFKKSSSSAPETDEDEIEVCGGGNEVNNKSDNEEEPRNFSHDTDTEEVSSSFQHRHHHHRSPRRRHRHASSRDGDESSSNNEQDEESDDTVRCSNKIIHSPHSNSEKSSICENRRGSFSPSSPQNSEGLSPQKRDSSLEETLGPIHPVSFSPMDFIGAQQLALAQQQQQQQQQHQQQHGLGNIPQAGNPFQFPTHHHHHLLQQNPSLASLMLLSSKYREMTSNMVKRSPN